MIFRTEYFKLLRQFIDKEQIKVITGIRRCGKSSLLRLLKDELLAKDKTSDQILFINFESFKFSEIQTAKALYNFVEKKIHPEQKTYLLLDEIQNVHQWEKAVNSFKVDFDVDIYITGSNSQLLSSELASHLAGRYVEIPMFTLSFKEYLSFREEYFEHSANAITTNFINYLRLGGFPVIHTVNYDKETAYQVIKDIYSSIILKDTLQRHKIRNVELLERVVKYAFDNVGNTFSGKNVADYFKSQQRKVDINTIYNYFTYLEGAFILYRVPRYDIKGKEILKTQEKFYLSDISLIYSVFGFRDRMISGILENIVFLELKRRGFEVYVGKQGNKEIDFIAEKKQNIIYIQVSYKLESQETIDREFSSLLSINDQFPKYVISMDDFFEDSIEGIQHLYISDFLLKDEL